MTTNEGSEPQPGFIRETIMSTDSTIRDEGPKTRRGKLIHTTPKPKKQNPISVAISSWVREARSEPLSPSDECPSVEATLVEKAPKRWVVYEPMVLLPSGSFTSSSWPSILASSTAEQKSLLWAKILREISPPGHLTHLAINEGIPLHLADSESKEVDITSEENTLRSPSGLKTLHGDFGPVLQPDQTPTVQDLEDAFWVSTKQNGITQIWAPRYTMFSRGNVKEKARLLTDFAPACSLRRNSAKPKPKVSCNSGATKEVLSKSAQDLDRGGESRDEGAQSQDKEQWAVDLYAGIGYFVFSYAKLGFRLLCWEINPWSVEGLRRGALANGWDVVVLSPSTMSSGSTPYADLEPSNSTLGPADSCPDRVRPAPGQATDDDKVAGDECDRKLAELVIGTESSTRSSNAITADNLKNDREKATHSSNPKRRNAATENQKPQIIVLLESNEFAEGRIRRLRRFISSQSTKSTSDDLEAQDKDLQNGYISSATSAPALAGSYPPDMEITHINAGFLPSSSKMWPSAWKMMVPDSSALLPKNGRNMDGWLHLHENVGVHEIEKRKAEIQARFDEWSGSASSISAGASDDSTSDVIFSTGEGSGKIRAINQEEQGSSTTTLVVGKNAAAVVVQANVEHVEMVKTFAPDVWHVVFDVHVTTTL